MDSRICLRFQILFIICMIAEIGFLFIWLRESFDTKNNMMKEKDNFYSQHFASITLDTTASSISLKSIQKEQNFSVSKQYIINVCSNLYSKNDNDELCNTSLTIPRFQIMKQVI